MKTDPVKMLEKIRGDRSMRSLAREMKCSAAYLSDVLRRQRTPGPKILKFLGLEKDTEVKTEYRRA